MALLQRFDDETTPPITAEDIRRRWVAFHKQIRLMSGTRFQRTAGRILGEDTWRYHVARFIFRPMLKVLRLRRRRNVAKVTRVVASKAATIFPINYRPLTIDYGHELASINFDDNDVIIFEIDESMASASDLINALNDVLNETTSEWLFLADKSLSEESRRYSVAKLLAHVTKVDDVVFGDEPGPNEFAPILKSPTVAPHTLLSYNVVGRPALLRVETLFRVGGFSPDAGWAFEHDAYLKLSEAKARFHHVTIVLPAGRVPSSFDAAGY